jgi:hypothetical protein
MVSAGRHQKKEVADALKRATDSGLLVEEIHRGHRWGEVSCPACGDSLSIWSTPRDPGTHGKQIDRFTVRHQHSLPSSTETGTA